MQLELCRNLKTCLQISFTKTLLMGFDVAAGVVVHLSWMDSFYLHDICQSLSKKEKLLTRTQHKAE